MREVTGVQENPSKYTLECAYRELHPTYNPAINFVEEEIIKRLSLEIDRVPVSPYETSRSIESIIVPGSTISNDLIKDEKISFTNYDSRLIIRQGKEPYTFTVDESFYIDAKTYPVTAVSQQFYNQWHSAPLQEYVSKSDVMKRLFPRLYPGEQNRFKGVVLERDIVTRRGNQRGLLRGGFLGEMAFRYLDAKSQKNGENGIDYIFIVLNGSNPEMADLYNRYTEAKKKLDSNHPSQLVKAVEGIIPYQTWGAKFKTEVQEVPAEIYKDLVLISAIRDRS